MIEIGVQRRWVLHVHRALGLLLGEVDRAKYDDEESLERLWNYCTRDSVHVLSRLRRRFDAKLEKSLGMDSAEALSIYLARRAEFWTDSPGFDESIPDDLPGILLDVNLAEVTRTRQSVRVQSNELEVVMSILSEFIVSVDRMWHRYVSGVIDVSVLWRYFNEGGARARLAAALQVLDAIIGDDAR